MNIGFVGMGKMGIPMATRLARAGHGVRGVVRTRRPELDGFLSAGGSLVASPREAASGAGCVFLMLPGPAEIVEVLRGETGVFAAVMRGALLIDCSTSLPSLTQTLGREAAALGARYVDAPVIGGPPVAAEGGLQFLVGATMEDFAEVGPILSQLGKEIVHIGAPGTGHAAKIVNNMIALSNMAVLGEGLALAGTLGLDADRMLQVLTKGFGSSYVSQRHMPKIVSGEFTPTFTLSMGLKDLRLAAELARDANYPLLVAGVARETFQMGERLGFGELNYTGVARVFEQFGKPLRKGPGEKPD